MAWVCLCHSINSTTIQRAIVECAAHQTLSPATTQPIPQPLLSEHPLRPAYIYQRLGIKPQCGQCKPVIQTMINAAQEPK